LLGGTGQRYVIPTPIARELQRMIKVLVPAPPWLRLGWQRAFVRPMFFGGMEGETHLPLQTSPIRSIVRGW
jgi:hypothetical protein